MGILSGRGKPKVSFLRAAQEAIFTLRAVGRDATTEGVGSFAKLTKSEIKVQDSRAALVSVEALGPILARHHEAAAAATMTFTRDADGFGALLLDSDSAHLLVDFLMGQDPGTTTELGELEESAVAESANIALNAMVTSAAQQSGARIKTGVPETHTDVAQALEGASQVPEGLDHVVLIETGFTEDTSGLSGVMLLGFFTQAGDR